MDGNLRGGFDMTDDKNAVQASQTMHFAQGKAEMSCRAPSKVISHHLIRALTSNGVR